MELVSAQEFKDLLIGIFILSLYFQTSWKFYLYVAISYFYFFVSDITGIGSETHYDFILFILIILSLAILEIKRIKKEEKNINDVTPLLPSKANKIFGAVLLTVYLLSRIFYFDKT